LLELTQDVTAEACILAQEVAYPEVALQRVRAAAARHPGPL